MAPITTYMMALWATSIAAAAPNSGLKKCGSAYYDPSQYTCYGSKVGQLCPIFNGIPDKLCGNACYSEYMYTCDNGVLRTLPPANTTFTLTAISPKYPEIHNMPIQAAGLHFYVSKTPGTYCPTVAGDICTTFPNNETYIYPGGSALAVMVPGGQQAYTQTDGAWAFTQAHSISLYNVSSYFLGPAYQGGGMFGPNNTNLIACPQSNGAGKTSWQVFADNPAVYRTATCLGFYARVNKKESGSFGAWQYT
ncbi:carbohydrate-binding module family 52 protein [Polychaeton citri CBS 116435]|uniref:Carbohydrate-binding module family 52 protein n=1 Tax=Polychaeton citri CBS 116435 TaxID=1314669 RepID=A0A9P4Q8M5_9PEZI|nr:carbohydrate-binding module family 52 protein [Polychaeton citri CBS 116435]